MRVLRALLSGGGGGWMAELLDKRALPSDRRRRRAAARGSEKTAITADLGTLYILRRLWLDTRSEVTLLNLAFCFLAV